MSRLLTAGAESGMLSQCDYNDIGHLATAWEYGVTDTQPVDVPSPGSGSLWGYECAVTNLTQWKHAAASELFYRIRFFITETTIGETIRFVHITDASGLERYHTGNENVDIGLHILANGTLRLTRDASWATTLADSASGLIAPQTWHLLQMRLKVANSGGVATVKIDGNTVIDFSGDTQATANGGTETILAIQGSTNRTIIFDDLAVNDTAGTFNNSYPEDRGVLGLVPNGMGTGTNSLIGTPEATDRHLNVDEVPASDPDYNSDTVADQYDLYAMEDADSGAVVALELWARAFYPATASTYKFVYKHDGVEYRSAALAPTEFTTFPPTTGVDGPWYRHIPLDGLPDTGGAWTLSALNALELGFEVATSQEIRNQQLFLEAEIEFAQDCVLTQDDGVVFLDASAGNVTLTIDGAQIRGRIYYVKRVDENTAKTVTIDASPWTIDGDATITLEPLDAVALVSDGTVWYRI